MVKQYKVIYSTHIDTLSELVNEAIAEGWQPQGGVWGKFTSLRHRLPNKPTYLRKQLSKGR